MNKGEEDRIKRRLFSRLCFIESDLEAIKILKIEDETIKELINGIGGKIDLIFELASKIYLDCENLKVIATVKNSEVICDVNTKQAIKLK